jgi:RNA polymerase sigma-70 factor (ECF subfamily)
METAELILKSLSDLEPRLLALWEATGDDGLHNICVGKDIHGNVLPRNSPERFDWICTVLMNCYKTAGDREAVTLLFELNQPSFLHSIQSRIRRCGAHVDPQDVLQEVFLNIYRYPNRFVAEHADSFRNWAYRIVRNTLLKALKGENRSLRTSQIDDEVQWEDARARTPYRAAQEAESAALVDWAYLVYLNLYLAHFERLSAKERRALTMVEVEGSSYRKAADALGIRLENLKMVIFRGRRKIFRGLEQTLQDLVTPPQADLAPCPGRVTTA